MLFCSHMMLGNRSGASRTKEGMQSVHEAGKNFENHGSLAVDGNVRSASEWKKDTVHSVFARGDVTGKHEDMGTFKEDRQGGQTEKGHDVDDAELAAENSKPEEEFPQDEMKTGAVIERQHDEPNVDDDDQTDVGKYKEPNAVVLQLSQGRSGSTVSATLTLEAHPYCGFFIDELVKMTEKNLHSWQWPARRIDMAAYVAKNECFANIDPMF